MVASSWFWILACRWCSKALANSTSETANLASARSALERADVSAESLPRRGDVYSSGLRPFLWLLFDDDDLATVDRTGLELVGDCAIAESNETSSLSMSCGGGVVSSAFGLDPDMIVSATAVQTKNSIDQFPFRFHQTT